MKAPLFFFSIILLCNVDISLAQATTVWIVRHAEKDVSKPGDADPPLSLAGLNRAKALADYIGAIKPDVVFSTPYKRTMQTASGFSSKPKIYDPKALKKLVDTVINRYKGKNVLIIGHSNTVLETIEAFGEKRPVEKLSEEDYDYIFRLRVHKSKVKVKTFHYGARHRDAASTSMKTE